MFIVLFCTVGMLFKMRGSWVLYLSQGEKLSGKRSEIDVQWRKNWDMCSYRFCTNWQIRKRCLKYFEAEAQTKKKNKSLQQKCSKGVDIKHQNQANFKRVFNFYLIKITNAEHVLPKVSNAISKVCHLHTPRTFPNPGT